MSNEIEIRRPENQLVVGRIPSWIARWGNLVILMIFLLLVYISFHLTFPVVIQGQVHISNDGIYVIIPLIKQDLVKTDQAVSLRLDDYPYMDYGILQGKISSLENIRQIGNTIYVPVTVFDDVNTVNRADLIPGMHGTGDIIVDKIPIIYRILKTK
jgi:hypothetical protein